MKCTPHLTKNRLEQSWIAQIEGGMLIRGFKPDFGGLVTQFGHGAEATTRRPPPHPAAE